VPDSPYEGLPPTKWLAKTKELVDAHPLDARELVEVVLASWDAIFKSKIGPHRFSIGRHICPKPQIMGFLLHELIPLEFSARYPDDWAGEKSAKDKDLVYIPDPTYSMEIKTSSHPTQIFGNRSYAQRPADSKKGKSGYYLAVNFQRFSKNVTKPRVRRVRFGWLDHTDWIGQKAATGQQARLPSDVENGKLLMLHVDDA
jgi:hypothetical protein